MESIDDRGFEGGEHRRSRSKLEQVEGRRNQNTRSSVVSTSKHAIVGGLQAISHTQHTVQHVQAIYGELGLRLSCSGLVLRSSVTLLGGVSASRDFT